MFLTGLIAKQTIGSAYQSKKVFGQKRVQYILTHHVRHLVYKLYPSPTRSDSAHTTIILSESSLSFKMADRTYNFAFSVLLLFLRISLEMVMYSLTSYCKGSLNFSLIVDQVISRLTEVKFTV